MIEMRKSECELFDGMITQLARGNFAEVVVDLQGVKRMDCDGNRSLQAARNLLQQAGRSIVLPELDREWPTAI